MAKVVIDELPEYDREMKLLSGDIIIFKDANNKVLKTYFVIPFRNSTNNPSWEETHKYCSLINLESGFIAFDEPCSRKTTELRILSHLCGCCDNPGKSNYSYDYSKIAGRSIEKYSDYEIHLKLKK